MTLKSSLQPRQLRCNTSALAAKGRIMDLAAGASWLSVSFGWCWLWKNDEGTLRHPWCLLSLHGAEPFTELRQALPDDALEVPIWFGQRVTSKHVRREVLDLRKAGAPQPGSEGFGAIAQRLLQ